MCRNILIGLGLLVGLASPALAQYDNRQDVEQAYRYGYRDVRSYQEDRQLAHRAQIQALNLPRINIPIRWGSDDTGSQGETMVVSEGRDQTGNRCRSLHEIVRLNGGRPSVQDGLACYNGYQWITVR